MFRAGPPLPRKYSSAPATSMQRSGAVIASWPRWLPFSITFRPRCKPRTWTYRELVRFSSTAREYCPVSTPIANAAYVAEYKMNDGLVPGEQ